MIHAYTCGARAPETERGAAPVRAVSGRRQRTVDIHCHLAFPEIDAMMRPHSSPEKEPATFFNSAASNDYNRQLFGTTLAPKLTSLEGRLADMDRLGIDVQAVSPSPNHYYYWADPELGRDSCRRVNDGMAEAVARFPERFVAMGTVPLQAPELAVAEVRRCVKELGFRGIEISSNVAGRELADPAFRPFFAAVEELDVLVFMHPLGFTHGQRLTEYYLNNVIGNPLESTIAVSHLIFGGVLERHPGLKLCVAHGGGYLPTYCGRMDHAHAVRPECRLHITRPPSEYLKRLFVDTVMFDPHQLASVVETFGADHVLLGTDYPYDMAEPDPVGFVGTLRALDEAARDQILGGNAARLLKI